MAVLVSPGVDVQVIDESITGTSGPGTIPLLFIATKSNKPITTSIGPVTNTIAPGTLKENANSLYLITSQRELIQTFGDPIFYSTQGTPIPGYELNEYGLLAAYQYLGIANRAFVVRADIDLSHLVPSVFEPTNPATNGTYWFDLSATKWGLFRSSGSTTIPSNGTEWANKVPFAIDDKDDMETVVIGNVAFASNTTAVGVSGTLSINGTNVAILNTDTVAQVVSKINAANITNIKSVALRYGSNSFIVVRNTKSQDILFGGTASVVTGLGFDSPTQVTQPSFSFGAQGDTAVLPLKTDNLMFEKIKPTGKFGDSDPDAVPFWFLIGSSTWKAATPTIRLGVSQTDYLSNPVLAGETLDISDGVNTVSVTFGALDVTTLSTIVTKINTDIASASLDDIFEATLFGSSNQILIVNKQGEDLLLTEGAGNSSAGVLVPLNLASVNGNKLFYKPHYQIPAGSVVGDFWIKTTEPNLGADYVVKLYNSTTGIWTVVDAPFYLNDDNALFTLGGGLAANSLYVKYNIYGDAINPVASHIIRKYLGPVTVNLIGSGIPGLTTPSLVAGDQFVLTVGQPNGTQVSEVITLSGTTLEDVVSDINSAITLSNVTADIVGGFLRITNTSGFSLTIGYFDPNTQTYVDTGNTADPLDSFGFTDGESTSRFVDLEYVASFTEPRTEAEAGRLWYNEDLLADVMYGDGDQWIGYRNQFPNTDPNGVIIAGSAPLTQTDGTPLVEHDLWLDGSDLENYPRLYRYRVLTQTWELIDNSDQTTPFGIVFADARYTDDGTPDGSRLQKDLVVSDFVDPDTINPQTFPAGILLFNTRASTYNVKEWQPDHFAEYVNKEESPGVQYSVGFSSFPTDTITNANKGRWVTASGNQLNGAMYAGRKAQRRMVVQALASVIASNQDIRSEITFFNLIATPGYPELIEEMITLNVDKKEVAFIVGDTPARLAPTGTALTNWANNANAVASTGDDGLAVRNTYVGLYYPWGLSTNTDGAEVVVPPSTIVLRTIAYNDAVAYPWFAPAGFNRGLVSNASSVGYITSEGEFLPVILNQGQRDVLYTNNINPIAYIPNRGLVVYGQKTLHPVASALDRVNVARLTNYLRYNFDILAKPFLFEPNDKQTRDQVQSVFERFIGNLVSLRGIQDFAVVCDETNNTPERIDRNELWVDVAILPIKAIEFIYIPIRIRNSSDDLQNFLPPEIS